MEEYDKNYFLCPGCKKAHSGDPDVEINDHTIGLCDQKNAPLIKGWEDALIVPNMTAARLQSGIAVGLSREAYQPMT